MQPSFSNKLVFFFLASLFLFTFSSHNLVNGKSDNVQLNLYYEALCPGCQQFIIEGLVKVFDTDLQDITDLKLVPFGNGHVSDNLTIDCQHGEEECKLNALEACVIRTYPDPKDHFKLIRCIEKDTKDWEKSCLESSPGQEAINDCYNGDMSKKLMLGYANETMSLKPEHEFVPWITINGKPIYDDIDDFVAQICKAYKGKAALPKSCNAAALSNSKVSKLQFSYADEATIY